MARTRTLPGRTTKASLRKISRNPSFLFSFYCVLTAVLHKAGLPRPCWLNSARGASLKLTISQLAPTKGMDLRVRNSRIQVSVCCLPAVETRTSCFFSPNNSFLIHIKEVTVSYAVRSHSVGVCNRLVHLLGAHCSLISHFLCFLQMLFIAGSFKLQGRVSYEYIN